MGTWMKACEDIEKAGILRDKSGNNPTAEQIFNYSPSGELMMIYEWHEIAKTVLNLEAT